MSYEQLERQVDTLSQAVELLLRLTAEQQSESDPRILTALQEELFALRTDPTYAAIADTPESLQPPFENVRPGGGLGGTSESAGEEKN